MMEIKGWVNSGVGLQLNQPIVISTMSVIDVGAGIWYKLEYYHVDIIL